MTETARTQYPKTTLKGLHCCINSVKLRFWAVVEDERLPDEVQPFMARIRKLQAEADALTEDMRASSLPFGVTVVPRLLEDFVYNSHY